MNLSKLVGSPDYIKTPTFQKRRKENGSEPDWDLIKQFKPTAKVERTDNEQLMQDIKGSMNKMTDKNYETLRDDILTKLSELENTDVYDRIWTLFLMSQVATVFIQRYMLHYIRS